MTSYLAWLDNLEGPPWMMFRGQAANWPLVPSIARIRGIKQILEGYDDWKVLELDIIERFAKYARPLLTREPSNVEEWLVHAQHFGAPTRLLDWSTNPLKALFWAVEDTRHDDKNGYIWALSPSHWRDDALQPTPLDDESLTPYLPKHLNQRLIAQEGCFVAFPLPANRRTLTPMETRGAYAGDIEALIAVRIPKRAKRLLRRELSVLGVTHRFIFPDLAGVAATVSAELEAQI